MQTMNGILIDSYPNTLEEALANLSSKSVDMPELSAKEVLVKIDAAPCNPSDLMFLIGQYGVSKKLPTIPGWEGTGTVVKAGGLMGKWLVGKRVACGSQAEGYGTWAQYFSTDWKSCVPISDKIDVADASSFLVNPFTAYAMIDIAKRHGHRTIIKTAAASQLGRIMNMMASDHNVNVINIVRREQQRKILADQGCKYILDQNADDFWDELSSLAKSLKATLCFEAISGDIAGKILNHMPRKSELHLYGALSGEAMSNLHPLDLIFKKKLVKGLYLGDWMQQAGLFGILKASKYVGGLFENKRISTTVQSEASLDTLGKSLISYNKNMTDGKVILRPFNN